MRKGFQKLLTLCLAGVVLGWASSPAFASETSRVPEGEAAGISGQQARVVTGIVTDALDGTPLVGATVSIKGSKDGVVCDIDGKYSIEVTSGKDVLVFQCMGYATREVPVEDLGVINVTMSYDSEFLDEVVVVGAGTQRKVTVTGALTAIKGDKLKAPSSSLTTSLAGRLAGVIVNTTSGEPGAASEFYIRGISTFGGRRTPLILLDDVEISTGDLNNIPAETIESFTILKDASATAIYGARGANGVMLITTKSGQENTKAKINVTLENAFLNPMNFPEFVDGATWMELYNEADLMRNPEAELRYSPEQIANTRSGVNPYLYPDVDWGGMMFKKMAMSQRANVNISGGGSRVTYYISLNANHDSGLINAPRYYSFDSNINNWSYNFQSNVAVKVTPTTKVRLNMNTQIRDLRGPNYTTSDLFNMSLTTNPIFFPATLPAQEGDTHVRFGNAYLSGSTLRTNPLAYMTSSYRQQNLNTINTTLRVDQDLKFITEGLSINALVNFKNYSIQSFTRTIDPYYYRLTAYNEDTGAYTMERLGTSGTDYISTSSIGKNSDRTFMLQFQLNYDRSFGDHNVGGMLMYQQRDYKADVLPNRNQGFSGRFTYNFAWRYLFEFNFGYNGTERLAKGDRFEFFPAVSLGWVISNEPFFRMAHEVVDNLKIRASYGLVGSDDLNYPYNFVYRDQVILDNIGFTTGDNYNQTMYGPLLDRYAVDNACWEKSRKLDIGLDVTLFGKWNMVFDYFHEHRYNILMMRASWPNSLGYSNAVPYAPIGRMNNWGYEFSTTYTQQFGKDWSLEFRGNFTYTQNKYIEMDEIWHEYPWQVQTGRPLSTHYGYVAEGLFTSQAEIDNHAVQELGSTPMVGDIKYRDLNGDGVINDYDQAYISELGTQPRIQYGFGLSLRWKKLDFGVFFNGSAMRKISINGIHPFGQNDYNIFQFVADTRWTEANPDPDAEYPRLGLTEALTDNNRVNSTYWLRDGSFLRLKQIEIGYSFKFGRVYVNGDNVAVFSPFKYWDPELSWNSYPLQRTFNVGIQLTF